MTYQNTITRMQGIVSANGPSWAAIDPESAARMAIQNRFATGLDIAKHTADIMRADVEEQVPQTGLARDRLQFLDDRQHLPAVTLGDFLFVAFLIGVDVFVHEGADALDQGFGLVAVIEHHGRFLLWLSPPSCHAARGKSSGKLHSPAATRRLALF